MKNERHDWIHFGWVLVGLIGTALGGILWIVVGLDERHLTSILP